MDSYSVIVRKFRKEGGIDLFHLKREGMMGV